VRQFRQSKSLYASSVRFLFLSHEVHLCRPHNSESAAPSVGSHSFFIEDSLVVAGDGPVPRRDNHEVIVPAAAKQLLKQPHVAVANLKLQVAAQCPPPGLLDEGRLVTDAHLQVQAPGVVLLAWGVIGVWRGRWGS